MKLLPNYSLKQILLAMIGVAIVMAGLASASRGSFYGLSLIASVVSLCLPLISLGLVYWVAYLLRASFRRDRSLVILGALLCPWNFANPGPCGTAASAQQAVPGSGNGYRITVDDSFSTTDSGFVNLRVKIEKSPSKPATQQELFTVVVGSQHQFPSERIIGSLVLEPGDVSASVHLAIPQTNSLFRYYAISVKRGIDASAPDHRDLFHSYIHSSSAGTNAAGAQLGLIWVTSIARENVGISHLVWNRRGVSQPTIVSNQAADAAARIIFDEVDAFGTTTKNFGTSVMTVREPSPIHPENLPDAWIGISGIKIVLISLGELEQLSQKHLIKTIALERWIAAGGTLVVFDLDKRWDPQNPAMDLEPNGQQAWRSANRIMSTLLVDRIEELGSWQDQWWKYSTVATVARPPNSVETTARGFLTQIENAEGGADWQLLDPSKLSEISEPFVVQRHVLGRVVAVPNHFENWTTKQWTNLWNAIEESGGSNPHFETVSASCDAYLSIPGVGKPPLKAFQILMCLFVLAAGPGVYSILKRTDQMQLFFFVVPILAFTSCFGLLAYVILIEGFGSYGRTQTVTWVDHRSQSSVTQARSMYYHGLAPAPYRHGSQAVPMSFSNVVQNSRLVHQASDVLVSGDGIRAREPHLFVNLASQRMDRALKLEPVDASRGVEGNSPQFRIVNGLGNDVAAVVFRTDQGWFIGERIGTGQAGSAAAIDSASAHRRMSDWVKRLAPLDEFTPELPDRNPRTEVGLIERLRNIQLAGSSPQQWIGEGTYIAILENFSEVDSLLQPVEFKHRMHVVVGRW